MAASDTPEHQRLCLGHDGPWIVINALNTYDINMPAKSHVGFAYGSSYTYQSFHGWADITTSLGIAQVAVQGPVVSPGIIHQIALCGIMVVRVKVPTDEGSVKGGFLISNGLPGILVAWVQDYDAYEANTTPNYYLSQTAGYVLSDPLDSQGNEIDTTTNPLRKGQEYVVKAYIFPSVL